MIIRKEYMTDEIINEIKMIDEKFYKENYYVDWYKERYNKNNYIFALYSKDKMVGYICVCGIKKELYNDIKEGKYDNDYNIDPCLFDDKSKYIYLSSINILKEYRNQGYGELLIKKVLSNLKNDIIAITVSNSGYNIAKKYMSYIKNVTKEVAIFERKEVK